MISIEDLRRSMGGRPDLSDEQMHELRDQLYGLARAMIEAYLWERKQKIKRRTHLKKAE